MTKNSPSSAIQTRAKEIGFSLNSSSLKKVKEHSIEDIILKQAEVFWQEYYSQKAKNVLENTKERGYNLSFEQQRGVDFLKNQEDHNCTIIAPTGFGKTLVVFEEMYRLLSTKNRIFFTAPTNDLLNQQYEAFCYFCEQKQQDVTVKRMEKGSEAFEDAKVVFLTPHLFEAIAGKNQVENNDVLVCDEMHTGE